MITTRKIAAIVGGIAVAGIVGFAGVAAATAAPSPSGSPAPSTSSESAPDEGRPGEGRERDGKHGRFGRMPRGLHGEWVVRGEEEGQYITVVGVRGEVTAVSATSITVKAEDGYSATFAVNGDTGVRGRDVDAIGEVKVGDRAGVVGPKTGDTLTARMVVVRAR